MLWLFMNKNTHAGDSRVGRMFSGVYVFVYINFFPHNISKTDAPRIISLDKDM